MTLSFVDFFFNSFLIERSYFKTDPRPLRTTAIVGSVPRQLFRCGEFARVWSAYNFFLLNILSANSRLLPMDAGVSSFDVATCLKSFFFNYKFLFFFFCEKLNKNIYKFSKYRLPKYSLKFFFIKPHKRSEKLISSFARLLPLAGLSGFRKKLYHYLYMFLFNRRRIQLFSLFRRVHNLIFKNFQLNLFLLNRTV